MSLPSARRALLPKEVGVGPGQTADTVTPSPANSTAIPKRLSPADFQRIMGVLLSHVGKERQADALVDKLDRQVLKYKDKRFAHPHDAIKHQAEP